MGDTRDTARTWLAERYRRAETLCDDSVCHECGGHPCESHVLDAILSAPGVEISADHILRSQWGDWLCDPGDKRATYVQVVIRLSAQPIGETP